jgi:hypothetical protein
MDPNRDHPFIRIQTAGWAIITFLIFALLLAVIAWFLRHAAPSLDDVAAAARYQTRGSIDQAQAASLSEAAIEAAIPGVARQLASSQPAAVEKPEQRVSASPTTKPSVPGTSNTLDPGGAPPASMNEPDPP